MVPRTKVDPFPLHLLPCCWSPHGHRASGAGGNAISDGRLVLPSGVADRGAWVNRNHLTVELMVEGPEVHSSNSVLFSKNSLMPRRILQGSMLIHFFRLGPFESFGTTVPLHFFVGIGYFVFRKHLS